MGWILYFLFLTPSILLAGYQEPEWFLMDRHGCIPFQKLSERMPPLSGVRTPQEFLEAMMKLKPGQAIFGFDAEEAKGAKLVPFIDKSRVSKELQKHMTKKNALVIVMKEEQGGLAFLTGDVCKAWEALERGPEE